MLLSIPAATACSPTARRGDTIVFASGADLQSVNPLLTVHPLARQVQRYALLTTLVRYDSLMRPIPYLARSWDWAPDSTSLTFHLAKVAWHDGRPTTARDVAWTLEAARDSQVGYPRRPEVVAVTSIETPDDSTVVLRFSTPQGAMPDVLTDLAILPAHLLDTVPRSRLRGAAWNEAPVGNGPFRFVRHEPNRRWVFERNPAFPESMGGPPGVARLVIAVVDEPMTKLSALVSGELDFAGIQPGHARYVEKRRELAVLDYPLLFYYVLVFNTRRPPLDSLQVRAAIAAALDRPELVEGYVYGFGTPGSEPSAMPAMPAMSARRPLELLTVGTSDNALEQLMQAQLAAAGIKVTIRQLELSAFLDRVYGTHDFDLAVMGVPGDRTGAWLASLAQVAGMKPPPTGVAGFVVDSLPATLLYQARGVQGMNRRVHNVEMDTRGELVTVAKWTVTQ
jgi:peptide/nickel transport system substrate-binding protein